MLQSKVNKDELRQFFSKYSFTSFGQKGLVENDQNFLAEQRDDRNTSLEVAPSSAVLFEKKPYAKKTFFKRQHVVSSTFLVDCTCTGSLLQ